MRYLNAHYVDFDSEHDPTIENEYKHQPSAWTVPDDVTAMLPEWFQDLLPRPLIVRKNLHVLDICAGAARITKWSELLGLNAMAMDRAYSADMDITTRKGLAMSILLLLRVVHGGIVFMGPQCSSWVWIGRSGTGRTAENPEGDINNNTVFEANRCNSAIAILCVIARRINVQFCVEQPASTLFFHTRAMKHAMSDCHRAHFNMAAFGHDMPKPTVLMGNSGWLADFPSPEITAKYSKDKKKAQGKRTSAYSIKVSPDGHKAVTGKRAALKSSQVYPVRFALEVVKNAFPQIPYLYR